MAKTDVTNPTLTINNVGVKYIPNTLSYDPGFGTQKMRTQSLGGGQSEVVYSNDISESYSTLKFHMTNTKENIELARGWKTNANNNAATLTDNDEFSKNFSNLALINKYEVNLISEGTIELEFCGDQAK
jgi:hypothetical protein